MINLPGPSASTLALIPSRLPATAGKPAIVGALLGTATAQLVAGVVVAVFIGAVVLAVIAVRRRHSQSPADPVAPISKATIGYYLAGVVFLSVSLDTSWRFFGDILDITNPAEHVVMFASVELGLVACAVGMRANVWSTRDGGKPGSPGAPRMVAWVLCGFACYCALVMAGPVAGLARAVLGPIAAMVMLHMALGIEIRNHHQARLGAWAKLAAEISERMLSWFGLGDDTRDARTRARERAARRAARQVLALADLHTDNPSARAMAVRRRLTNRLSRALRRADVAHDPRVRTWMLAELAVLRHAGDLVELDQTSPWEPNRARRAAPIAGPGVEQPPPAPPSTPVPATATPANTTPDVAGPGDPRHAKPADVVDMTSTGRADWITDGMTTKDAMYGYLDRQPTTPGAVLTAWARQQGFECGDDYGRNVRRQCATTGSNPTPPSERCDPR